MKTPFARVRYSWTALTLFFLFAVVMLAACGGSGSGGSSSTNVDYSGTITIWHGWEGTYLQAKQKIFNGYMNLHPKVKIVLVHQQDIAAKSVTAIKAGNGPDIVAFADDNLGKLALSKVVVPMDQYISEDFLRQTYSPAAADALIFNGHVYGVPE